MVEFENEHKFIKKFIQLILLFMPLFTLFFTWSGIYGVKQYTGIVYVYRNVLTCSLGAIVLLVELFLNLDCTHKIGLNLLGNLIFWAPLFYAALNETNNINDVTIMYYISIAIVCLCCILQLKMIYTLKPHTVWF